MRILLALLVLALPLLAQGSEDKKDKKPEEAAGLKSLLKSWEVKLDEKQKAEIEKLSPQVLKLLVELTTEPRPGAGVRLVFERAPTEAIRGTWEEEGKKGRYALKSLGAGRYELHATILNKDGKKTEIKEAGTLAELRKKYSFLSDTIMIGTRHGLSAGTFQFHPNKPELGEVGLLVHPASPELRHHLAIAQGAGMVVAAVIPGSRAEKLGLQKYDILIKLGGELIDAPNQLKKLRANEGTLEYIRRGKTRTLDLATTAESESKR